MDVFLVLQILFDAVLLFGVLFLFHYAMNLQQKKKEDLDIVNNLQVQETKENLEKLMAAIKQLGKEVSDDIQKKINDSEEKAELFQDKVRQLERELSITMELAGEIGEERGRLEHKAKLLRETLDRKEKLPSDEKVSVKKAEKKKKPAPVRPSYSVGFSSGVVRQVYKMADADAEMVEIAKATKLTKAEINLILNLRENRFTTPN